MPYLVIGEQINANGRRARIRERFDKLSSALAFYNEKQNAENVAWIDEPEEYSFDSELYPPTILHIHLIESDVYYQIVKPDHEHYRLLRGAHGLVVNINDEEYSPELVDYIGGLADIKKMDDSVRLSDGNCLVVMTEFAV